MKIKISFFFCLLLLSNYHRLFAQVTFKKHVVSGKFVSEGVATADVNHDGKKDVIAGNYWFEAPQWQPQLIHVDTLNPVPQYSTSFLNYTLDINNDGWDDLIRFDQPGGVCAWYENPKNKKGLWSRHIILDSAGIENPAFVDVDGDGRKDIICNDIISKQVLWLKAPVTKNDTSWQRFIISRDNERATHRYTHGLGFGDVNLDGKNDVIIKSGWWQSPADPTQQDWQFHPADFGEDCSNMFVLDVDKDGDADVISASAHNYGIWWHEQTEDSAGNTVWKTHLISKLFSQSHALVLADINKDGHPDLVTGKRYRAHNGEDPGANEPSVLYWFEFKPSSNPEWLPHLIDANSGIGLSFVVEDFNGNGLPDVIVSNKKGVYYFEQVKH